MLNICEDGRLPCMDSFQVRVEFDGKLSKGIHRYDWNIQGYPAGLHFWSLLTEQGLQTGKIMKR